MIRPVLWTNLVAVDGDDVTLHVAGGNRLLDARIFAADDRVVTDVSSTGRHCGRDGRRTNREAIIDPYKAETKTLLESL